MSRRIGSCLCGAAALMGGWLAVALWLGPAAPPRRWPLPIDAVLAFAAVAAFLGAAGVALRKGPLALVVLLAGAGAPLANTRLIGSQDTEPAALLPFSIVREGTLTLPGPATYVVPLRSGKFASKYPIATALLALPIALPAAAGHGALTLKLRNVVEKLSASVLTGLMLALLFVAQRRVAGTRPALIASALTLFGTSTLPILGQALWQHSGAALALSAGLAALGLPQGSRRSALVGLCAGVAIACRPPDILPALGLLRLALHPHTVPKFGDTIETILNSNSKFVLCPRIFSARVAALGAAVPVLLTLLYQAAMFGGALRTGYGAEATTGWRPPWPDGALGFLGLWFSPARGLLACYPVLLFALFALWKSRSFRPLAIAIAAEAALIGCWWAWEGGWCQGPRMLADAIPFLGLGLALALADFPGWARPARASLFAAAALSCATAMALTYVYPSRASFALFGQLREGRWTPRGWPLYAYLFAR